MLKNLALLVAGAAAATTFVIACSDDSPGDADAAVCDCPAAEPPLAGRITRVEDRRTSMALIPFAAANCPVTATLLGGGCFTEGNERLTPQLIMSGEPTAGMATTYSCQWRNSTMVEVTTVAFAICLNPAQ